MCARDYWEQRRPGEQAPRNEASDYRLVCPRKEEEHRKNFENAVERARLTEENERLLAIIENLSRKRG